MSSEYSLEQVPARTPVLRIFQLIIAVLCMMTISSPQYVWTLFTTPLGHKLGYGLASIQVTFSLLIIIQTLFSPLQGWLLERFGIRTLISIGCLLSGSSWVLSGYTDSLWGLYLAYGVLGGIGTGIVYLGCVALMVRYFPDRRGFAVGMVASGYGMGAMLTTLPISHLLDTHGLNTTLIVFGAIMAVIGIVLAQFLRVPDVTAIGIPGAGYSAKRYGIKTAKVIHKETKPYREEKELSEDGLEAERQFTPRQMLATPLFWLMFIMFTLMATSGLMVTSQLATFAHDFGIASITLFGMSAIPLALTLDRLCNGATRPLFGWISDHIGRENTMALAFGMEGVAMTLWLVLIHHPVIFVLMSGVVFLGWGEIFSLFPSLLTDVFGTRHAATNYGFLYIAQGIGSILGGPLAATLYSTQHSWIPVFILTISCDFVTALLALFVLKRWRMNV
ncbi:Oxalate:formate antiporter [Halomonadaceae bacterium LMG 33818]|uniref:MFS transporter n=1 Tax=Cernens ardua TaxID=3402176 RepID=UPI003EDC4E48